MQMKIVGRAIDSDLGRVRRKEEVTFELWTNL